MTARPKLALDLTLLCVAKAAVGAWILHAGFTHVSDDDYARVVIAQTFAHAPRLDPSGTSWLPFPFWLYGGALAVVGRSLAAARGVAFVLGVLGVPPVYVALRRAGVDRAPALASVVIAMAIPWSAWVAVSTVPEGFVGPLTAAALIAARDDRARWLSGGALLAASLSRYEVWPACGVFAAYAGWQAWRGGGARRLRDACAVALALAGPAAWMAWNARAHGSATHFLARVSAYRAALGPSGLVQAYPAALLAMAPLLAVLTALGVLGLFERERLRRWALPLLASGATLAFLIVGDLRGGAPTHHPERALLGVAWVVVAASVDGAHGLIRRLAVAGHTKRAMLVVGAVVAGTVAVVAQAAVAWRDFPGKGERSAQVERGLALRARGVRALEITPCAYEHFALLAAYGAPERARIVGAPGPAEKRPVTAECPLVQEP